MSMSEFLRPGRCFVIAEAGVNHNRSIDLAKQLVAASKAAGADAVKFQTWITEDVMTRDAAMADYQRENHGADVGQFQMAKDLELSFDDFRVISDYAREIGILFFSTPDEVKSADFLDSIGVPLFKIGSAEVTNTSFLRYVAAKGRPVILSTGMSDLGEVEAAVRTIEATGNRDLAILHCVSNYPADPSECNLRAMDTLAAAFGYPVGFSDHTLGGDVAVAAVARGATIIEKHITLDVSLPGPDHKASLDPAAFAAMVRGIRAAEAAIGDGVKRLMPSEVATRTIVRRSIVAARDLPAGTVLADADLAVKRPGNGIPSRHLDSMTGRILRNALARDQRLTWGDLADG
jgi:N-acetylneuraminate synthase